MPQAGDPPAKPGRVWWLAGLAIADCAGIIVWAAATRGGPSPAPGPAAERPITDFVAEPAEDVRSPDEAWRRAREIESGRRGTERERAAAALPYYLCVVSAQDAQGRRDANSPEAARRIAEIVEKFAASEAERLTAAKYRLTAVGLYIGAGQARACVGWRRAEGPYLRAGKSAELAGLLARFADNARIRAQEMGAAADPAARARAIEMADLAVELSGRAKELVELDKK